MFLSSFFFDTLNSAKAEVLRCGLSQRAIAGKGSHYIDQIMIVYLYIVDPWGRKKVGDQSVKNSKQKHCKGVDQK